MIKDINNQDILSAVKSSKEIPYNRSSCWIEEQADKKWAVMASINQGDKKTIALYQTIEEAKTALKTFHDTILIPGIGAKVKEVDVDVSKVE